jgi:hypothetical protein
MSKLWTRIWRGSENRLTRFHDQKGNLPLRCISDIGDCIYAFATTGVRKLLGLRPAIPWIALPALRFIEKSLPRNAVVFEWGSGMSTIWYERHCAEVHAVEDDPAWYETISRRLQSAKIYLLNDEDYIAKISSFPEHYFDMVVIDGNHRYRCFAEVGKRLRPHGLLLIDNSDNDRTTHGDLWRIDQELEDGQGELEIKRFSGWAAGNFFPQETTVVRFAEASCPVTKLALR